MEANVRQNRRQREGAKEKARDWCRCDRSFPHGQAASLFLKRRGHHVEVFERVPNPQPIGAGFLLQPTAYIPLKNLGVFDQIKQHGSKINFLSGITSKQKVVLDLKYTELHEDLHGLGLSRGTLYSILLEEMKKENIPITPGLEIVDIVNHKENESNLIDSTGKPIGPFDLVVVADGARSKLREKIHSQHTKVRPYRWGTLFAIVEDVNSEFTKSETLQQIFKGTNKMMGILPTGYRSKGSVNPQVVSEKHPEAPLVTLFWSVHKNDIEKWRTTVFDEWKKEVAALSAKSKAILDHLSRHENLTYANYYDVRMNPYYSPRLKNVVFIGDCAHAMSPVLGQGVNLALQDAMLLAESLDLEADVESALKSYSAKRKPILFFYQNVSRWLNPWFQSSHIPGFAFTRDLLFAPVTGSSKILKEYMLLTLAGAKKSFFSFSSTKNIIEWRFWNHQISSPEKREFLER
eukprot:TRINITY_DN5565_c0_g1_i3.p1 TRINITY_DN5565_c0_g1~~TRINITY_DN5565_c0_g1_i3.p1  ORF type:complete len:462 (+),score=79.00 TRINITY_DN5565_c0_g1_i3:44-1429(+)